MYSIRHIHFPRSLEHGQTPVYQSLENHNIMSQTLSSELPMEQNKLPKFRFTEGIPSDNQQSRYIVVALSHRKQCQVMEGIDQVHSQDVPFATWTVVSQALSAALFAQPDYLRLKSMMNLHQKDYLLFEQASSSGSGNQSSTAVISKGILEVDIGSQVDGSAWLCHWKPARPAVADLVQNCKKFYSSPNVSH